MEAAANIVALDPAIAERRAAMRAAVLHDMRLAGGAAIERVMLAAELDPLEEVRLQLGRDADRLPIALDVAAGQGSRPDMGEILPGMLLGHVRRFLLILPGNIDQFAGARKILMSFALVSSFAGFSSHQVTPSWRNFTPSRSASARILAAWESGNMERSRCQVRQASAWPSGVIMKARKSLA